MKGAPKKFFFFSVDQIVLEEMANKQFLNYSKMSMLSLPYFMGDFKSKPSSREYWAFQIVTWQPWSVAFLHMSCCYMNGMNGMQGLEIVF